MTSWQCGKLGHRFITAALRQSTLSMSRSVVATLSVHSTTSTPPAIPITGVAHQQSVPTSHCICISATWKFAQRCFFFFEREKSFEDCDSDTWTDVLADGGTTTHVWPTWSVHEISIQMMERGSWLRQLCAASGQSLLQLSGQKKLIESASVSQLPTSEVR